MNGNNALYNFPAHPLAVNLVVMEITGFEQDYEYISFNGIWESRQSPLCSFFSLHTGHSSETLEKLFITLSLKKY